MPIVALQLVLAVGQVNVVIATGRPALLIFPELELGYGPQLDADDVDIDELEPAISSAIAVTAMLAMEAAVAAAAVSAYVDPWHLATKTGGGGTGRNVTRLAAAAHADVGDFAERRKLVAISIGVPGGDGAGEDDDDGEFEFTSTVSRGGWTRTRSLIVAPAVPVALAQVLDMHPEFDAAAEVRDRKLAGRVDFRRSGSRSASGSAPVPVQFGPAHAWSRAGLGVGFCAAESSISSSRIIAFLTAPLIRWSRSCGSTARD